MAVAILDGNLNLNYDVTRTLLTQAAWQAGPPLPDTDVISREAHIVLEDSSFCKDIIKSLFTATTATEENWQGTRLMQTFIALVLRMLSLCPDLNIRKQCFELITRIRYITVLWLRPWIEKLQTSDDDGQRASWTSHALEIALTCVSTFEVDLSDMAEMFAGKNSVAIFTECAITIHNLCPTSRVDLLKNIQKALSRFSRLTYSLEPLLHSILMHD